jgi:hypothetical protein
MWERCRRSERRYVGVCPIERAIRPARTDSGNINLRADGQDKRAAHEATVLSVNSFSLIESGGSDAPRSVVLEHGVEDDKQFADASNLDRLERLAGGTQPDSECFDCGVVASSGERGHV